jgi:F-type H+-transporting ATPase subunit b
MFLEINPLVLPDIGLVFWNTVAFLGLLVVLGKFAWKPMLKAISDREKGIEDSLAKADKMKADLTAMQNENEALLAKAREERATLIKEAKEAAAPTSKAIANEVANQLGFDSVKKSIT